MKNHISYKGQLKIYMGWPIYLSILLILMQIPIYLWDQRAGYALTAYTVVYLVTVIIIYYTSKPRLANEIISFATQYAAVQKRLLNEFEIPYALLDYSGKLLWSNEQFSELTGVDKNYHKSITTLFPTITREFLQKTEENQNVRIEKEDKIFRLSVNRIYFDAIAEDSKLVEMEGSDEFLTAIYLFDETMLEHYKTENIEQKQVSALVYIDNYDEALESVEDVKRSLLIALVDRKVNKYFGNIDGLVRKIEKDKYFVVFKRKYLDTLKEDKFSILEDIKSVKVGNEMSVTLSIGVGICGDSYIENYEYSRNAIDLALGRGGDQVVLKEGDEITYYGGKAKQVERNTRVKARVKAHALREIMETRENVIIMGHSLTDVDSLGAAIGVYCAAKVLGKKAQIVVNGATTSVRPLMECFTSEKGYPEDLFIDSHQALYHLDRIHIHL